MSQVLLQTDSGSLVHHHTDEHGLPRLQVQSKTGEARIYLNGATVTHFQPIHQDPVLFVSDKSCFEAGKPIRGGIPIIFPWFGNRDGFPAHGFARNRPWQILSIEEIRPGIPQIVLWLESSKEDPFDFRMTYEVTVAEELHLKLSVTNRGSSSVVLENCLHTYFQVGAVSQVEIQGLEGAAYLDKVEGFVEKRQAEEPIVFHGEVDRIYLDTDATTEIDDPLLGRRIRIQKQGSRSTVVWNPGPARARQLSDLGEENFSKFVCVESGNVSRNSLTLYPQETTTLAVIVSSHPQPSRGG